MNMKISNKDILGNLINEVIEKMAQEKDWHKSWNLSLWLRNFESQKPYSGINIFLLAVLMASRGHQSPEFLTFNQAKKLGKKVKKGVKSYPIFYYNFYEKEEEVEENGESVIKKVSVPFLKRYNVFNIEDIEGIETKSTKEVEIKNEAIASFVEKIKNIVPIRVGNPAFVPGGDYIKMPSVGDFESEEEYASALFHELVHWTGHKTRLNRPMSYSFGSEKYAFEEAIAEFGAIILANHFGIKSAIIDNSAAYINGWLKKIKADDNKVKIFYRAAKNAVSAVEYLLSIVDDADAAKESSNARI